jgi:hypothetical protein
MSINTLDALEQRRQANVGKQIDNSLLYAGSPMYYYCHGCGDKTVTLPEGWYQTPPPRFCDPCKQLVEAGEMERDGEPYDTWLEEHGHDKVPR